MQLRHQWWQLSRTLASNKMVAVVVIRPVAFCGLSQKRERRVLACAVVLGYDNVVADRVEVDAAAVGVDVADSLVTFDPAWLSNCRRGRGKRAKSVPQMAAVLIRTITLVLLMIVGMGRGSTSKWYGLPFQTAACTGAIRQVGRQWIWSSAWKDVASHRRGCRGDRRDDTMNCHIGLRCGVPSR